VSTDSEEIAEVAREHGAEMPFLRPAELATDAAPTEPTILHAIEWVRKEGWEPNLVVLLQATSPIRSADSIDRAIAQLVAEGADSLVGVVPSSPFLWHLGDPPTAEYPILCRPRRQDMTNAMVPLREIGSLYVTPTAIDDDLVNRIGGKVSLFVMDESEGLDIDTEIDILLADRLLDQLGNHG
jgi:N-acylneuraminate cytidylyltransferase